MDLAHPRSATSGAPSPQSGTLWRILVALGAIFALAVMLLASCPVREEAHLDAGEPAYVETVAGAPAAAPRVPAPPSTRDSAGGVGTTTVTSGETPGPQPKPR